MQQLVLLLLCRTSGASTVGTILTVNGTTNVNNINATNIAGTRYIEYYWYI